MREPARTRRSMYFVPGDDRSKMETAADTAADAVVLDLEDMVPEPNKERARDTVSDVVAATDFGRTEVCVRINDLRTGHWHADLMCVVDAGVDTVRLAKVERAWEVKAVVEILRATCEEPPEVMITIESPSGMQHGSDIASVGAESPVVTGIGVGLQDYTDAMGVPAPTTEIRASVLQSIAEFASVNGIEALGADFIHVSDERGLRESAEQAKAFGHIGQPVLHPDQIAVVNDVFTPSEAEYEAAKRKVEAYDAADESAVLVGGEFLEAPMVNRYRRTIERYERINA